MCEAGSSPTSTVASPTRPSSLTSRATCARMRAATSRPSISVAGTAPTLTSPRRGREGADDPGALRRPRARRLRRDPGASRRGRRLARAGRGGLLGRPPRRGRGRDADAEAGRGDWRDVRARAARGAHDRRACGRPRALARRARRCALRGQRPRGLPLHERQDRRALVLRRRLRPGGSRPRLLIPVREISVGHYELEEPWGRLVEVARTVEPLAGDSHSDSHHPHLIRTYALKDRTTRASALLCKSIE